MITAAAVPVKDLATAKQRLVSILSLSERQQLARAMLEDVLGALGGAGLDLVWVVTRDPEVMELARRFPVTILEEAENRGHTEAVALAQHRAAELEADRFLTIPADVPQVTAEEIVRVCRAAGSPPSVVFVPSRSGYGTNAALLAPPEVMPLKFGEPSFTNHVSAARQRGIEPVMLSLPGLGLDLDGAEDLRALLEANGSSRASELARILGIEPRLGKGRP